MTGSLSWNGKHQSRQSRLIYEIVAASRIPCFLSDRGERAFRWFWEQLPEVIRERTLPQLHGEEIAKIVRPLHL